MENAKDFCLPNQEGEEICLKDLLKNYDYVVLYFYPKDNTPGCTMEAVEFTKLLNEFKKLNAIIVGVSTDSVESHKKFCEKYNLRIHLLSDKEKKIVKAYKVWKLKSMAGKKYYGIERSTFLINKHGKIVYEWRRVNPRGHAKEVLQTLKSLIKQ